MTKAWPRKPNTAVSPTCGARGAGGVDHGVVVDRRRRRHLDAEQRRGGRRRLGRDDRLHVVVREDRVDVEAAAEAIGLAAGEMRDLGQIEHRRQFRQILHDVQRRCAVQAVAGLALRRAGLGQRRQHDRWRWCRAR